MEESDQPEEHKHPTKSLTSQPQEEFIEQKARPSRPDHREPDETAPKPAAKPE
jgi:hypothetical protein